MSSLRAVGARNLAVLIAGLCALAIPAADASVTVATWTPAGALAPSARWGHAMAYDSARNRTVLFGGSEGDGETWEWDGLAWTRRMPAVAPPPRVDHAMAFDEERHVVVLFGGIVDHQRANDTWEWDGEVWRARTAPVLPPARFKHAMAYDAARLRVVLFGGVDAEGTFLGDTWEWDGTQWTFRSIDGPTARHGAAMAFDASRQRTVLFGGRRAWVPPEPHRNNFLSDTWEWDGVSWTQAYPAISPPRRESHAMAPMPDAGGVVIFAGYNFDLGITPGHQGELSDTWVWTGESWNQLRPLASPRALRWHDMAFDSAANRIVLFGGEDCLVFGCDSDSLTWLLAVSALGG